MGIAGLLIYGLALAVAGPWLLLGRQATRRAPRLGVVAWLMAAFSTAAAATAGGLMLAFPDLPSHDLAHLFVDCADTMQAAGAHPDDAALRLFGLALAVAVPARSFWSALRGHLAARRERRSHAETLRLVGRPAPDLGAVVLEADTPAVYCLPGRAPKVVVTRAALGVLSSQELSAVLAHERAHIRGRHHLVLASVRALAGAFPFVPLFRHAAAEIPRLLEMCADDSAAGRYGRRSVITAIRTLAGAPAPAQTLAAAVTATEERLLRLVRPTARQALARIILAAGASLLLAGPLVAVAAPYIAGTLHHWIFCPLPSS